jgi:uncharacterized protein DUF3806
VAEVRALTDEERAWVARMVDAATTIAAAYRLAPPPGQPMEPARLDTLWRSWLSDPGFAGQDPMLFLNPFGLALGQWLVDRTGLDWAMATDELGTGVAIRDEAGEIVVLPVDVVRKGFESRSAAFFVEVAREVEEQIRSGRAPADAPGEPGTAPTPDADAETPLEPDVASGSAPTPAGDDETALEPEVASGSAPTPEADAVTALQPGGAAAATGPEAAQGPSEDDAAAAAVEPADEITMSEPEQRKRTGLGRLFGRR